MHTAVFTIISPNYRHYARALMSSVKRWHPAWDRFVLLVGEPQAAIRDDELFTTVGLNALPLPNPRCFCFRYTVLELNTAVKPWMFEQLFGRGYDRVVFLDPDIFLYSPLVEVDEAPAETFLTLTPHMTDLVSANVDRREHAILEAGAYNLGFLVVSRRPPLPRFLAWWQQKLEFQCVVSPEDGLFVDQKWMDLAPGLFPDVAILRHEGYNVAYWNLQERKVARSDDGATVNGQPLRFVHFSGFDPGHRSLVSKHDRDLKLGDIGDARMLFDDYSDALHEAGYGSFKNAPYTFGTFTDGTPIPDAARLAYRDSATIQSACGGDPFAHHELFTEFRRTRRRGLWTARAGVTSYRVLSRARPIVRLIPRSARAALREFLLGHRDPKPTGISVDGTLEPGLNIVGYVSRETGVGESARLCRRACERDGLPSHVIDIDAVRAAEQVIYRASIYHVNADQTPEVRDQIPHIFESSSYNIGCWHWELPELPDAWAGSADDLDEIWAPSAFVQSAVSRKVTIPVVHMPHGIEIRDIEACSPEDLGVPRGRFTFLCMFDFDSVIARKNPLGAVDAFVRAFRRESPATLLIKTVHAATHAEEYADLQERLRGATNVCVADRMLSRAQVNGLIAACDSVVSLHRSEGFGLILAEAMALGKPVIATGWSGNMDFMNSGNSCPIGYRLVTIDRDCGSYQAGQQWAEPDLDHAAHEMRRVVEDSAWRAQLGERARNTIRSEFSPEAAALRYRRRLDFLGLMGRRTSRSSN